MAIWDLLNAQTFVDNHRDESRWVPEWKMWLYWTGKQWKEDVGGMKVQEWAVAYTTGNSDVKNLLQLAKHQLVVHPIELDAHPMLLNTPNGILDLEPEFLGDPDYDHSQILRPHDPSLLLTKMTAVGWQSREKLFEIFEHGNEEDQPEFRWDAFLEEVQPDPEYRDYLQRWAGHMLSGSVHDEEMLILLGDGANGKTVFVGVIEDVLGDYAGPGDHALLLDGEGKGVDYKEAVAGTRGLRMVAVSETPPGSKLSVKAIKRLMSKDTIRTRRLFENGWEMKPTAKIVMFSNYEPQVHETDEGTWRRIKKVPWNVTIPKQDWIRDLQEQIVAHEGGYVLDWLYAGWWKYQQRRLDMPIELEILNEEYRAEQDIIGRFIDSTNWVMGDPNSWVPCSNFTTQLREWCKEEVLPVPNSHQKANALEKKGITREKHNHAWHYRGIERGQIIHDQP